MITITCATRFVLLFRNARNNSGQRLQSTTIGWFIGASVSAPGARVCVQTRTEILGGGGGGGGSYICNKKSSSLKHTFFSKLFVGS